MIPPVPKALLSVVLAAALAGCMGQDFDWQPIQTTDGGVGSHFRWRSSDELWVTGGSAVVRRVSGKWEELDVCGQYAQSAGFNQKRQVTATFDGSDVWVLCGQNQTDGQVLLKISGTTATVVDLPKDGNLQLVDLPSGLALLGGANLWVRDGNGWKTLPGPATSNGPQDRITGLAGLSPNEIYSGSQYWNGITWKAWADADTPAKCSFIGTETLASVVLDGTRIRCGVAELKAGVLQPPLEWQARTEVLQRGLGLVTIGPDDLGIFGASAGTATYFWRAAPGDSAPTYLGSAPIAAGTMYGGGGLGAVFAIDADTLLVHGSSGNDMGNTKDKDTFMEGRR